ncbi:MAG TPA: LptF/LptG family permease, partial [Rubricoccaceae bacterium]
LSAFARRDGGMGRTDRSMRTSDMLVIVDSLTAVGAARRDTFAAILARGGRMPGDVTLVSSLDLGLPAALPASPDAELAPGIARRAASGTPRIAPERAVLAGLSDAERMVVLDLAAQRMRTVRGAAETAATAAEWDRQQADRYRVEIYKKNSIALACLVFVLVGVPLGLSVSRAGVGLVASLAVFVFLFYWITLVQGEKLADREILPPWLGMWAANAIIGVLGAYLFAREALDPALPDPIRALAGRFSKRD